MEKKLNTNFLTGFRFIAASIVVIFHFGRDLDLVALVGRGVLTAGPQMVGFFFVLSGFIMAYVYLARPSFTLSEYFVARFSRIVPLYVLAFCVLYFFGRLPFGSL